MSRAAKRSSSAVSPSGFENLESRLMFSKAPLFKVVNFVSNDTTTVPAVTQDKNIVDAWGLANGPGTDQWVVNNGSGTVTLYDGTGAVNSLVVTVPSPAGAGQQSFPTGTVYNGTNSFQVSNNNPAEFLFASEDGTISGWSPNQADPTKAVIKVDKSGGGATYRGLATTVFNNNNFLLATNDATGKIDVFDSNFQPAHLNGSFKDAKIPSNYEPFGIQNINGLIYVTYALKSIYEGGTPEGSGYVDVYLPDGSLDHRLVKRGTLNSPWGIARIPGGFGKFKRDIAVGNFGDGRIQVFDPKTGEFRGFFRKAKNGKPVDIDGLWGLAFGNGGSAGAITDLYFTAGPNSESNGLFGKISIAAAAKPAAATPPPTTQPPTTQPPSTQPPYVYPMAASAASTQSQLFAQSGDNKNCDHSADQSGDTAPSV